MAESPCFEKITGRELILVLLADDCRDGGKAITAGDHDHSQPPMLLQCLKHDARASDHFVIGMWCNHQHIERQALSLFQRYLLGW